MVNLSPSPLFWVVCGVLTAAPNLLFGDLLFETTRQESKAETEQTEIDVTYSFQNTGDQAVRILNLDSSCGCLSAATDRQVYAAGESGTLSAKFKLGSMVGEVEKVIYVSHSGAPEKVKLACAVSIPEVMRIEPRVLNWQLGEKISSKQFTILVMGEDPIKVTGLESTRAQFTHSLETVKEGREYLLTVTPTSTKEVLMGAIKVTTDSPIPKYQRHMAFTAVTKSRPTTPTKAAAP